MNYKRISTINQPSKNLVIAFNLIWLLALVLLLLASTDFFSISLINKSYLLVYIPMLFSTIFTYRLNIKFLKNRFKNK